MAEITPKASGKLRVLFWLLVILSFVTIVLGAWRWQQSRARIAGQSRPDVTAAAGAVAPDFELSDTDGHELSLRDLRGQVVLLNFWATWCPPCDAEMPDLNALHERYGASERFTVVGVNQKEDQATVRAFVERRQLSFPILLDSDGSVLKRFGVRVLPMSLIIDREGRIRDSWYGQIAREAMLARLQRVW